MLFATLLHRIDLEGIMLSEISQKDECPILSLICGILKPPKKNKKQNKLIDTENRMVAAA